VDGADTIYDGSHAVTKDCDWRQQKEPREPITVSLTWHLSSS